MQVRHVHRTPAGLDRGRRGTPRHARPFRSRVYWCGWATLSSAQGACAGGVVSPDGDRAQAAALAGVYALVDATGALADTGRSLLRLAPAAANAGPAYQWTVFPRGPLTGAGDVGDWAIVSERVEFRSAAGNGRYNPALRRGSDAAAAPVLDVPAAGVSGGTYTFRRIRKSNGPAAFLSVAVVDTMGALVAGGSAELTAPDSITTTAGFSGFRSFVTSGPPGEWTVTVIPAGGYRLAPGQANPVRVVVPAGATPTDLLIRVTRTGGP